MNKSHTYTVERKTCCMIPYKVQAQVELIPGDRCPMVGTLGEDTEWKAA